MAETYLNFQAENNPCKPDLKLNSSNVLSQWKPNLHPT